MLEPIENFSFRHLELLDFGLGSEVIFQARQSSNWHVSPSLHSPTCLVEHIAILNLKILNLLSLQLALFLAAQSFATTPQLGKTVYLTLQSLSIITIQF